MRILNLITAIAIFSITLYSCDGTSTKESTTTLTRQKTAEELKEELKVREQMAPTQYLSVKANLRENITQKPGLFRHTKTDGYILSGTVTNTASIAKFKDVVVIVSYLSETDTEIEAKEYVIYKFIGPSSVTDFEYKIYPPSGFKNFSIQISNATPAN